MPIVLLFSQLTPCIQLCIYPELQKKKKKNEPYKLPMTRYRYLQQLKHLNEFICVGTTYPPNIVHLNSQLTITKPTSIYRSQSTFIHHPIYTKF